MATLTYTAQRVSRPRYARTAQTLARLFDRPHSPEWQAGFQAAVEAVARSLNYPHLLQDARLTRTALVPRVTTAPERLDAVGTRRLGRLGGHYPSHQEFRLVHIERQHLPWQEARYQRQGYTSFDKETWALLLETPEFRREYVPVPLPKRKLNYDNFKGRSPNTVLVLENRRRRGQM